MNRGDFTPSKSGERGNSDRMLLVHIILESF